MDNREIARVLESIGPYYYGGNLYDEKEITAAARVIYNQSPFRFYGKSCQFEAEAFEAEAARFYGTERAYTVNSGSGALLMALHALNIGPGDEVLVPAYFWIAVSNTILLRGAIPVVCEVDESLCLDPAEIGRKATKKTRCAVAVHMYGGQADMDAVMAACLPRGIRVIEDFSQANGGSLRGRRLGSIGTIGITSLQLNKMITSGEGGLVLIKDEDAYCRVTARADMGYARRKGVSTTEPGNPYVTFGEGRRFNEVSAAIMRVQLSKLPGMVAAMRETKAAIVKAIGASSKVTLRPSPDPDGDCASTLTLQFGSAEKAAEFLRVGRERFGEGAWHVGSLIETGQHVYYNCTNLVEKREVLPGGFPWSLPANAGSYAYGKGSCPRSEQILARSVGASLTPTMNAIQRDALAEAIVRVLHDVKV